MMCGLGFGVRGGEVPIPSGIANRGRGRKGWGRVVCCAGSATRLGARADELMEFVIGVLTRRSLAFDLRWRSARRGTRWCWTSAVVPASQPGCYFYAVGPFGIRGLYRGIGVVVGRPADSDLEVW